MLYHNLKDMSAYCDYIKQDKSGVEIKELVNAVCTNTTEFFREEPHFEFLNRYLRNFDCMRNNKLYIWSAACSSGEEPYSICMSAKENLSDINSLDFKVLATDIDTSALTEALRAEYSEQRIRKVGRKLLTRYFTKETANYRINDTITRLVYFRHLNLIDNFSFEVKFDVIFCRNVLIYFDRETCAQVLNKLCAKLARGGYLCIGHTESIYNLKLDYALEYIQPSVYRLK